MSRVRCEVTGRLPVAGVTRPGRVELDDELVNVRALVKAGHVRILADPAFQPAEHTVDEVLAYLDHAGDDERDRVLDAERAGKARKTILGDDEGD